MPLQKVLVVDDSPTQLMMYKMALKKGGYDVVTAKDGSEGITKSDEENPDIIVSDIMMPELNGYLFCRLLKNDPKKSHIPVILLTSLDQQQDRFWGIEAGADSYIVKDTDTAKLLEEVEKLLKNTANRMPSEPIMTGKKLIAEEGFKTKINWILDRLLFESTISNRIRDIAKHVYDHEKLVKEFFDLLNQLMDYSVAVMLIHIPEGSYFATDCKEPIQETFLSEVDQHVMGTLKKIPEACQYQRSGSEFVQNSGAAAVKSEIILPLTAEGKVLGVLSVHSGSSNFYKEDNHNTLRIISKELVVLLQYFSKIQEIERIRMEYSSVIVQDMKIPMDTIISFTEALLNKVSGELTAEQNDILKHIQESAKKVQKIADAMAQLSKKVYKEGL